MSLSIDQFALNLLSVLGRIADSAEKLAGSAPVSAPAGTSDKGNTESAADKKKRLAAEKAEAEKNSAPKADRAAVNKSLVALKDTVSKEAAQEVYQRWNYTAMSKIEEKDFDAILAASEQELKDFAEKTGRYAESALDEDDI